MSHHMNELPKGMIYPGVTTALEHFFQRMNKQEDDLHHLHRSLAVMSPMVTNAVGRVQRYGPADYHVLNEFGIDRKNKGYLDVVVETLKLMRFGVAVQDPTGKWEHVQITVYIDMQALRDVALYHELKRKQLG